MAGETIITVVGNLTDAPELRFTPTGTAVAKFTVASTPRTLDKASGQWRDGEAMFLRCTAWQQLAENAAESLARGARVIVSGRLTQSHWETAEGEKRSGFELQIDEIGPSLRFATATVNKLARTAGTNGASPADDPWANASRTRPADPGSSSDAAPGGFSTDEPPF